jgi:hypothetical protein
VSVTVRPSTAVTASATVALVMLLLGLRSHGRLPSPVPFSAAGKITTSSAPSLPSAAGAEAMPTKSPTLMSPSEALATPETFQSALSLIASDWPSRVFTVSVEPSNVETVPRTRTLSAACAPPVTAMTAPSARARFFNVILISSF